MNGRTRSRYDGAFTAGAARPTSSPVATPRPARRTRTLATTSSAANPTSSPNANGQTVPLAGAEYFAAQAKVPQNIAALAAADYQLPEQRYFDLQCLVYGSNPARNAKLLGGNLIPRSQAQTCVYSYRREARSWQRLLGPDLRHADALLPQHY